MKDIYKTMLNVIVEPICDQDPGLLREIVRRLKQADAESWAVGEMLERAMRYIGYTTALSAEMQGKEYPADLEGWLGLEVRRLG